MACIEGCDCGNDKGCPECGGSGIIIEDAMVWGAKRGYNPLPIKSRLSSNIDYNKPSLLSRFIDWLMH